MTDYTPTTEEVRNQYSGFSTSNSNHTGQVYINLAKFDRWLAEVKAQERKAERKRALSIIMTNIGQIVWQARHNPEGEAIDTSKMLKEIMGIDDE